MTAPVNDTTPRRRDGDMAKAVRQTLIAILRRGSIVNTDDPIEIDEACRQQEAIAAEIEGCAPNRATSADTSSTSREIEKLLAELRAENLVIDFEVRWRAGRPREQKPATFALQDRIVALVERSLNGTAIRAATVPSEADLAKAIEADLEQSDYAERTKDGHLRTYYAGYDLSWASAQAARVAFDLLKRDQSSPVSNPVAEPAHPSTLERERLRPDRAGDSGSDQGTQGGTADDRESRGRHGPQPFSPVTDASTEEIATAVRQERERCAKIANEWLHGPTMLLRAGEMSMQEKRTALAIVANIDQAIRNPSESSGER